MKLKYNEDDLIRFEKQVIEKYKKGETYGPVHLSGSINKEQEKFLTKLFKENINENDWIFATHRAHYVSLLKSNNWDWLMNEIIVNANSSHINSKKYKIFTSAIVGGCIPIALGAAVGIKLKKRKEHVYCFVGDMASEMGCFNEAIKYAEGFDLPITFIIEDNDLGCNTPTRTCWGLERLENSSKKIIHYKYKRVYPHYGIGEWVILRNEKLKTQGDYSTHKLK